ncbi:hypothetical protein ABTE84_21085, partial [Acinetobacter baumannii]
FRGFLERIQRVPQIRFGDEVVRGAAAPGELPPRAEHGRGRLRAARFHGGSNPLGKGRGHPLGGRGEKTGRFGGMPRAGSR